MCIRDSRKTIYYNTFNVTSLLTEKNAIAIKLGNGRMFPMRLEKAYKTPFFGYPKDVYKRQAWFRRSIASRFSSIW